MTAKPTLAGSEVRQTRPQKWILRPPYLKGLRRKPSPSEGAKVARYPCFSLECRVPIQPKFIVRISERFRAAANSHFCKAYGDGTPSFALFGHERQPDVVGDHQHAFYLPMARKGDPSEGTDAKPGRFLRDLHIWCPYGFTQAEVEILVRVNRLDWGSGRYPVRPVLTALSKEPHEGIAPALPDDARERWRQAFAARAAEVRALLQDIKARLPELTALLEKARSHWHGEDGFYRFYHQSFKVYRLQADTL